jgi:hypothetical protein
MFTEQGVAGGSPDAADVDGGPTRLLSPALDLLGLVPELHYSYWMFNLLEDDSLVVELSPDGSSWFTARTVTGGTGGWQRDVVDIGQYFTPTSAVRVRFSVADSTGVSVTESAIDNVCVRALGSGLCVLPQVYCTSKVSSALCVPTISFSGTPSGSSLAPFTIRADRILEEKTGLLFYGHGTSGQPFKGGYLCVTTPVRRTPTQDSGGNATIEDCTGVLTFDMNAWIRSGVDSALTAGAFVAAQYYFRDPQDPFTVGLSDAVQFTICP